MSLREQIARVIDPKSFRRFDRIPRYASHIPHETQLEWSLDLKPSLEKADQIIAMMEARK